VALKAVLKSLEGLSEEIAGMYRKEGDDYVLDISEADIKAHPAAGAQQRALQRIRDEKKAADDKLADALAQFDGLDPEAARAALAKLEEDADKKLIEEGDVDAIVAKRLEKANADFAKQITAKDDVIAGLQTNLDSRSGELSEIKIFDAVKDAALGKGARKEALTDIQNRAKGTWQLGEDGNPVAMNGEDPVYGKGGDPMSIDEWVEGLSAEATYLFEPNTGGGAGGGDGKAGGAGQGGVKVLAASAAGDNLAAIASGEAVIDRS
jgi:hypothetical protein